MPFLRAVICATKFHLHGLPPFVFHQDKPQDFSSERGENCTFRTKTPDRSSVIFPDERSEKFYNLRVNNRAACGKKSCGTFGPATNCDPNSGTGSLRRRARAESPRTLRGRRSCARLSARGCRRERSIPAG